MTRLVLTPLEDRLTPTAIGSLDPTFGTAGQATPSVGPGVNLVDLAPTNDGGIIAAGYNATSMVVVKLLNDGSLDPSFGTGGKLAITAPGGKLAFATSVVAQPDGTFLVAGGGVSATPGDLSDFAFVRVSATGVASPVTLIDASGAGLADEVVDIAVNPTDGTVYLAGTASTAPGGVASNIAVVRLNSALVQQGAPVLTKLSAGGLDDAAGVALDSTGRVYVSGTANRFGANPNVAVVRYNANLTAPTAKQFDLTAGAVGGGESGGQVGINSQDQVFVNSTIAGAGGAPIDTAVIQLDTSLNLQKTAKIDFNGTPDLGYGLTVDVFDRVVITSAVFTAGGKVDLGIARLLPGSLNLDPSFDVDGKQIVVVNGTPQFAAQFIGPPALPVVGLTLDNRQQIIVSGLDATPNPVLARLEGTVGLPPFSLIGGTPDGNGQVLTVSPPAFNQFDTPGIPVGLIPGFNGVVRTAIADVNGDGFGDLIAGSGPGGQRVIVYDGATNAELANFLPFEASFTSGVFVSAGDFNNDGKAKVVVTPDQGGGARIIIYNGSGLTGATTNPPVMANFFGLADLAGVADDGFRGGARTSVADVNGDGRPDLIVAAGFLGGPRVTIWNGVSVAAAGGGVPNQNPIANFFAFEDTLRNGAFVAAGDVNGDGSDDLIFGGGPTGGPRVRIADGKGVVAVGASFSLDQAGRESLTLVNYFAGDPNTRGGVRVSARDIDGDQFADLVTGSGDALPSAVRLSLGTSLVASPTNPAVDQTLDPFNSVLADGVFVG